MAALDPFHPSEMPVESWGWNWQFLLCLIFLCSARFRCRRWVGWNELGLFSPSGTQIVHQIQLAHTYRWFSRWWWYMTSSQHNDAFPHARPLRQKLCFTFKYFRTTLTLIPKLSTDFSTLQRSNDKVGRNVPQKRMCWARSWVFVQPLGTVDWSGTQIFHQNQNASELRLTDAEIWGNDPWWNKNVSTVISASTLDSHFTRMEWTLGHSQRRMLCDVSIEQMTAIASFGSRFARIWYLTRIYLGGFKPLNSHIKWLFASEFWWQFN